MNPQSDCIFCKIAAGKVPAHCIWEDERAFAFLDINPLAPGHSLLIPKVHVVDIRDTPADLAAHLFAKAPRIATAVHEATASSGVNILQNSGAAAGQAVFHLHIHFIPRFENDGLGFRWNAGQYSDGQAEACLHAIRDKLR